MPYYAMNTHRLSRFEPSKTKGKKYDAILTAYHVSPGTAPIERRVPFGAMRKDGTPYPQYKDRIGLYSAYDHGNQDRRRRYIARHKKDEKAGMFSPGYFSLYFLW